MQIDIIDLVKDKLVNESEPDRFLVIADLIGSDLEKYDSKYIDPLLHSLDGYRSSEDRENNAVACEILSVLYEKLNDNNKAMVYEQERFDLYESMDNDLLKADSLYRMGMLCQNQSRFDEAAEYILKSLNLNDEIYSEFGQGKCLGLLGRIFATMENYDKALSHFNRALDIWEKLGSDVKIAQTLNGIGIVYWSKNDYKKAIEFYQKSLKAWITSGSKRGMAAALNNIGVLYFDLKDFENAIEYYNQSLAIKTEINDKNGTSATLCNLGEVRLSEKKYDDAKDYFLRGLGIAREMGFQEMIMNTSDGLYKLYLELEDFQMALEAYQDFIKARDHVKSEEARRKIAELNLSYETQRKEKEAEINRLKYIELENVNQELKRVNEELQNALSQVKELKGFLPICMHCKKIRDDQGYWNQLEEYISSHSGADFSHSICPDCLKKAYAELDEST